MANKSERLLVCLSGGAGQRYAPFCVYMSWATMYALVMSITTSVGRKATEISIFVKKLCERLGVELKVFHADVVGYCKEHSVSTEEGGKKA